MALLSRRMIGGGLGLGLSLACLRAATCSSGNKEEAFGLKPSTPMTAQPGSFVNAAVYRTEDGSINTRPFLGILLNDNDANGKQRCESGQPVQQDFTTSSYVCVSRVRSSPKGNPDDNFALKDMAQKGGRFSINHYVGNATDGYVEVTYSGHLETRLTGGESQIFIDSVNNSVGNGLVHRWLDTNLKLLPE